MLTNGNLGLIRLIGQVVVAVIIVVSTAYMIVDEIVIPDAWWVFGTAAIGFTFSGPPPKTDTPIKPN